MISSGGLSPGHSERRFGTGPLQGPGLGFLLVLLLTLTGCKGQGAADLQPLPEVDLAAAEEAARAQLEEARRRVETAEDQEPAELAEAYGDLGLLYVLYELLEGAEVSFANAHALAPEDHRWAYLQAYAAGLQGRLEDAAAGYEEALELDASVLPAWLRLGRAHLDLGAAEAAQEAFERALQLEPASAAGHEGLGKAAAAAGDAAAAEEHLQRALALEPRANALHYALAQVYRDLGRPEEAEHHLALRGDVSPRIPDPLINALAERAGGAQFYLMQGAEALEDGDLPAAEASYRSALEKDPASFTAVLGLARSLEGQGRPAEAAQALQAAAVGEGPTRSTEERAALLRSLGDLLSRAGRPQEAAAAYALALETGQDDPRLRLLLGDALARSGQLEQAVEAYDEVAESSPDLATAALVKRATARVNLRQPEQAKADFEAALVTAPQDPGLRLRYAEALAFLGEGSAAREQRKQALELLPSGPAGATVLAESAERALRRGDLAAAEADYTRALELDPASPTARRGLAEVFLASGRLGEAVAQLRKALEGDPSSQATHRALVAALILDGRFGEARLQLQESLRTFPREVDLALDQVRLLSTSPDPAVRDGALALEVALRVNEAAPSPAARAALALAHAAAGRWDEAVALQGRLAEEAKEQGDVARQALYTARLRSFEQQRPWTAGSGEEILGL